jgi:hypothetical protein
MDQTLKQLGELLLGSIPTVIFLLLTYALLRHHRAQAAGVKSVGRSARAKTDRTQ